MKKFTLAAAVIFLANCLVAQRIQQVGTGEYYTAYLTDSGAVYVPINIGNRIFTKKLNSNAVFTDVQCGISSAVAIDKQGTVYSIGPGKTGAGLYATVVNDVNGNSFSRASSVYAYSNSFVALKDGSAYIWGQDIFNLNKGKNILSPTRLQPPAGLFLKKLVPLAFDNNALMALASDGSVWRYSRASVLPQRLPVSGAKDIAGIGAGVYVVETGSDLLAWGFLGSYLGVPNMGTKPVSIKKQWQAAGCVFPLRQMAGSYNTLHVIDANNNLFGAGDNVHGQVGNGRQWPDWSSYSPMPFNWSFAHGELLQKPVQITGRFSKIFSSPVNVFFQYATDMAGNLYSWGRNKAHTLGNGATLDWRGDASFPEALNVPAPVLVDPINVKWKYYISFDPAQNMPPFAHAGINQYINSATAFLDASFSHQQKGRIVSYAWQKDMEGSAVIETPLSALTKVTGLQPGENRFRVLVTNNFADTASAVVSVFVR